MNTKLEELLQTSSKLEDKNNTLSDLQNLLSSDKIKAADTATKQAIEKNINSQLAIYNQITKTENDLANAKQNKNEVKQAELEKKLAEYQVQLKTLELELNNTINSIQDSVFIEVQDDSNTSNNNNSSSDNDSNTNNISKLLIKPSINSQSQEKTGKALDRVKIFRLEKEVNVLENEVKENPDNLITRNILEIKTRQLNALKK